jgi:hypothetical protein
MQYFVVTPFAAYLIQPAAMGSVLVCSSEEFAAKLVSCSSNILRCQAAYSFLCSSRVGMMTRVDSAKGNHIMQQGQSRTALEQQQLSSNLCCNITDRVHGGCI